MKRFLAIILSCIMAASLSACGNKPADLNTKGIELIEKLDTLAECEDYISLYTGNPEINESIKAIADRDYSSPAAAFSVKNLADAMYMVQTNGLSFSEEITDMVKDKMSGTFPMTLNGLGGVNNVVIGSILNYSESFIDSSIKEPVTCFYLYGDGISFAVSYIPANDGIVNAAAQIIINDDMADCTDAVQLLELLQTLTEYENFVIEAL